MDICHSETADDGHHYAGSITGVLLGYVRRTYGEDAVGRIVALAGESRPAAALEKLETWSSYRQVVSLYEAAAQATGDAEIGQRAGEELIRQYRGTAVEALLRELGSPGEVLRNVAQTAAKFSTVTEMEALEVGPTDAVVMARSVKGFRRTSVMCGYTKGVLSQASALFGMNLAVVEELECQVRGGDRCVYRVSWDPSTIEENLQQRIHQLEAELLAITTRFEALQATATDLVGARDVEELLSFVADRAADTVRAPRHLLAVRTTSSGPLHVHARGFDESVVSDVVAEIMAPEPTDDGGSRLIVDISSRTQNYGRLAAIYPQGACFLPAEHRLLTAYAGHAAAALEAAAARQEAERRNATARALLALASSLAQVGTRAEVATRLADAVPHVVTCTSACVFLRDDDNQTLRLCGASGLDADDEHRLRAEPILAAEMPALAAMMEDPHPQVFEQTAVAERLRLSGHATGSGSVVVVPITYRREFFGVVTATVDDNEALSDDEHLLERLLGMADHAATALLNARLLEQIRHQATHDGLTGLPNRLLLKDRVDHALARTQRTTTTTALFFVDLDDFKRINDTLGHSAGDQLLMQVATRLGQLVRPSDTVARLGGDEFVIVASDLDDVHAVESLAKRLGAGVEQPYEIEGADVNATASIGVATMHRDDTYETLLRNGDEAMYDAKRRRKTQSGPTPDRS